MVALAAVAVAFLQGGNLVVANVAAHTQRVVVRHAGVGPVAWSGDGKLVSAGGRIAGGPNTECSIAARTGRHVHDRSHWLAHVRIDAIGDKADDFHRSLYDVAWPDRYPSSDRTLAVEVHAGECGIDDADAGDGFVAFVDLRCDVTGTKVASLTYVHAHGFEEARRDVKKIGRTSFD